MRMTATFDYGESKHIRLLVVSRKKEDFDISSASYVLTKDGANDPEDSGNVVIDEHVLGKLEINQKILSPGMKYRHYAPKAKCILVYSKDNLKMINKINEVLHEYNNPVVIACTENIKMYNIKNKIDIGSKENLEEISKNLFTDLRKVDKYNPDIVIIEGVNKSGMGLAIMNRLIRACEYNYIEI